MKNAIAYLALANRLIHEVKPDSLTIGEDVSGMPGLTVPASEGGYGFDYRFAMGVPDYWVRLVKEVRDEDWPMGQLFHEFDQPPAGRANHFLRPSPTTRRWWATKP